MGIGLLQKKLHLVNIGRVLFFSGILTVLTLLCLFANPYGSYLSILSYSNAGLISMSHDTERVPGHSKLSGSDFVHDQNSHIDDAPLSHHTRQIDSEFEVVEKNLSQVSAHQREGHVGSRISTLNISMGKECVGLAFDGRRERPDMSIAGSSIQEASGCIREMIVGEHVDYAHLDHELGSEKSVLSAEFNFSLEYGSKHKFKDGDSLNVVSTDVYVMANDTSFRKRGGKAMSIVQMNSMLLNKHVGMKWKRPQLSSQRDRELQGAKFQIQNAPIRKDVSEVYSSLFRNYSIFKRSYELMESKLKVYVYRDGKKPIFHTPYMRGTYASEGWFMKLMERNKQFVVKDPKRAHLFYVPFSSVKLRSALNGSGFAAHKDLENHLKNYVDIISTKYRFWNRRGGADHFLVACHDWAPAFTNSVFKSSIRVLCNSNLAQGFQIGKDVSLPVTYIRSSENPLRDIGGNPPSNRPILAFFAGRMHGYVRPLLLHHWHNKEPDMKILGPMPRDIKGKAKYRSFMKSSKYCICARGYQVHTPRVVESIYYECVPVIISDNYVPPFFEVFEWESFAVFVLEEDIPKLRDILASISEERYAMMRRRLKMVQRYFLWHKVPERYDLFHMILHSVWFNRVFQVAV